MAGNVDGTVWETVLRMTEKSTYIYIYIFIRSKWHFKETV